MKQLSFLLVGIFALLCYRASSQTLPAGFSVTTIGSGWNLPLGTAFTSDGQKMFVWEKDGRVWVCNRNSSGTYIKQTTPVLDISEEVANWGDHGLMGFALDPNYLNNGLIYLLYVVDRYYLMNFGTPGYNPASSTSGGATIGRITRYKTMASGSNTITDLSSRFILLGETRQTGICIMHDSHGLGTLAFAADGTLLATAGDGGSYYLVDKGSDTDTNFDQALADGIIRPAENVGAFRAQLLNSHNGKLLRIDPVTGNGVSSNPYYSAAQPRSPKSRVWAFGLRNPYRFSIKPGTGSTNPAAGDVGEIYVGDVGWNTYEEVSIISTPGVNCGWPLFEGLTAQPGYTAALTANLDEPNPLYGIGGCTKQYFNFQDLLKQVTADNNKTIYNPCNPATPIGTGNRYVHFRPSIEWKHFTDEARVGIFSGNTASVAIIGTPESNVIGTPFPGNCATGGPWYNGSNFPVAYQNKYFVADHDGKWIRCFSVDFTDVVTEVKSFGTGFLGTVNVNVNPLDGTLVVVELGDFASIGPAIKQVRYGGNQAPVVKMTSDKKFGPSALNVNFTGNTSSDPDGSITGYAWNFGDGATSTTANPSHSFNAPANTPTKYVVKLTVTDNLGATSMDSIIISVNNTPPLVNITSPVKNSLYKIGPDTLYTCAATVTDAEHTAAALKYEWQTFLRHNSHVHPEGISNAISPTTNISRIGCNGDEYYWFIKLTVTDAAGLSAIDSAKIFPDCNPGVDNIPPTVSSVLPLNAATSVSTGTTVSAVFSETIDPVTLTAATFQIKDAANNIVPGSITTSFNQVVFTPAAALGGSTVYTATIKGGSPGVKDVAGNSLVNDYSWSFTTVDVDIAAPTVISVIPANGAAPVSPATTVIANFNEAINPSTVNGTTFQLRNAANNLVTATISTSADKITLVPSAPLAPLSTYTATITGGASGVKDLAGNALASNYVWSFTTDAIDNTPPTIISVLPANAAIGVSLSASITANLSEAINASSVTGTSFILKDAQNNIIPTSVTTSSGVLTLIPSSALVTSTTYTATIAGGSSGIKDLAGNALVNNYSWSFTTVGGTSAPPVAIQSFDSKNGIGLTTHSLAAVPAGALLVLSTTADAFPTDCIVTSAPALTWTKRVDAAATNSDNAEIWTAVYPSGGAITVTSNWGAEFSQASVCYIVLNAENTLNGAFGTAVLQAAPSVTITTSRNNSIIFGCTADWHAVNGATRTLRDAATERYYFKDGNYTTYHYTKAATTAGAYTEGVSLPSTQQASTSLLEIRGNISVTAVPPTITTHPVSQSVCSGANVSFSSSATGGTPVVKWQTSSDGITWSDINGAVNATLTFTVSAADNNKQYRAVWTNSDGPASSNPATLTVNSILAPQINVVNNCGSSELTAVTFGGTLLWSNGATSPSITVISAGTYTVTQTVNGCTSAPANAVAAPKSIPLEPTVSVLNNCGNSVLTASGTSGSLLWNTGETTESITVTTAGIYTVTQTVNGCTGTFGSATAAPKTPATQTPIVTVVNNCGNSVLTASAFTGSLLWSTGETTSTITVTTGGTYTVAQILNGCTSPSAQGIASPLTSAPTPLVSVVNNCGNSVLTASGFTGSLLWSTGETTASISVATAGTYTVMQTVATCTSDAGSGVAAPKSVPSAPGISVVDHCGKSVISANGFTGSLLWSTGETTPSIVVTSAGSYSVTQQINGCTSSAANVVASPLVSTVESPTISVINNCGNSVLTASGYTGTLLWSTGETSSSIIVTSGGDYKVTQTVDGCTSPAANGTAAPLPGPSSPVILVQNNCGNSVLTATGYSGSVLWSTGETTSFITVNAPGTYSVKQTVNGCISSDGIGIAAPKSIPAPPIVGVVDNCGNSQLMAFDYTGSLMWNTGETTSSINVSTAGNYTLTQTINGCTSNAGTGTAAPKAIPLAPAVSVNDNCGYSVLTVAPISGALLWSNGANTPSITVTAGGTYSVTETINGCASPAGTGIASPKAMAVLSSSLTAASISGTAFAYTPASNTGGTTFTWSRAAVTGISNSAASGAGAINETLVNTLNNSVNVTYVITLSANGCTNTQNVVVSVSSAMVVTGVSPANGVAGVSPLSNITAIFSEALNGTTVTATTVQLKDAGNNIIPATISASSNLVTILPTSALSNSMTYTVTIKGGASGVKGSTGSALANDYTWAFTTETVSSQPVTIQSFNTKTGTAATVHALTGVPAGALLVLATTADAALSDCIVSSSPALTWTKRVDAGAAKSDNAEIWTALFSAGGTISVTSNWGTGNSQASVCYIVLNAEPVLSGTFGTGVLQAAPSVSISTSRSNSIIFGCTADWKGVNGTNRTLRDAATERLYFRDNHYTTYHYTKSATNIAAYTEGVSAPTGQQSSTAILEIRSAAGTVDNTPPTITSVSPVNGATGVAASSTASAVFSEAMNASTINSTNIELRNSSNVLIAATVSYNANTNTTTLTPSSPLVNSTSFTVTIKGGASGVKDAAGNAMVNNYSWSFTTEAGDIIPPIVTSVTPLNGATNVNTSANIVANFSEPLNAATVTNTSFQLRDAGNNLITASVNTLSGQITLDPVSNLLAGTVYTATISGGVSGVKDLAGNTLVNNYSWSFTTDVGDIIPPTVTSVAPLNGATSVDVVGNIAANFSEAVNASTVTTTTFQLRDAGNNLIPASVSTLSGQIILDPTSTLSASKVYTATITGGASGVKDLAGNALASNYSWSFTTSSVTSQPVTIQSVSTKTGTAATVHALTAVPAGSLLILAATADAVVSDCIISSSPALTWSKRVDAGAVNSDNAEIWTAVYPAGGSISVTSNWGAGNSQSSVCYVVLNAEPTLGGTFGTAVLQASPSVTVNTTRENSIIFGCTADWMAVNGATRTFRDAATERLYFRDGNYTTYHYTKTTTAMTAYTEGISAPTGQQSSTALLEIRGVAPVATRPLNSLITTISNPNSNVYTYSLGQNFPNPFDEGTDIPFTISRAENVNLALYDMQGRMVRVLINGSRDAGHHTVHLDAGTLAKGIYFYKLQSGEFTAVKKLIIW